MLQSGAISRSTGTKSSSNYYSKNLKSSYSNYQSILAEQEMGEFIDFHFGYHAADGCAICARTKFRRIYKDGIQPPYTRLPPKWRWLSNFKCFLLDAILSSIYPESQDLDDVDWTYIRHHPESIERLQERTKFNRKELQLMYRGFKQVCPTGVVQLDQFREIFGQFYPQGVSTKYANFVFRTFDRDGNGQLTFEEFIIGLSSLCRGNDDDKLEWIFQLYDVRGQGQITKVEVQRIIGSMYELMGRFTQPPVNAEEIKQHVESVYERLDPKKTGNISLREFLDVCKADPAIMNALVLFDTRF